MQEANVGVSHTQVIRNPTVQREEDVEPMCPWTPQAVLVKLIVNFDPVPESWGTEVKKPFSLLSLTQSGTETLAMVPSM